MSRPAQTACLPAPSHGHSTCAPRSDRVGRLRPAVRVRERRHRSLHMLPLSIDSDPRMDDVLATKAQRNQLACRCMLEGT